VYETVRETDRQTNTTHYAAHWDGRIINLMAENIAANMVINI